MNTLTVNFCYSSLYESIAALIELVIICLVPLNRKYLQENWLPCLFSGINIILSPLCIVLAALSFHNLNYVTPISFIVFIASNIVLIYSTVLLVSCVIMCVKKKPLSELRFARSGEMLKKALQKGKELRAAKVPFAKRLLIILLPAVSL